MARENRGGPKSSIVLSVYWDIFYLEIFVKRINTYGFSFTRIQNRIELNKHFYFHHFRSHTSIKWMYYFICGLHANNPLRPINFEARFEYLFGSGISKCSGFKCGAVQLQLHNIYWNSSDLKVLFSLAIGIWISKIKDIPTVHQIETQIMIDAILSRWYTCTTYEQVELKSDSHSSWQS